MGRPALEVADIFRAHGPAWRQAQRTHLSLGQLKVMSAIDGSRAVRAHGDREMPVWGEIFRKETEGAKYSELTALLKGKLIAEYVATLQR